MPGKSMADKIPDVYFDWYARFLPGAFAVVYYYYFSGKNPNYSVNYFIFYAAIGYGLGHAVQPISSFIVKIAESILRSDEKKYNQAKNIADNYGQLKVISKGHSEAVGMFSTSILFIVVNIYIGFWSVFTIFLPFYFVSASIERIWARKVKIDSL